MKSDLMTAERVLRRVNTPPEGKHPPPRLMSKGDPRAHVGFEVVVAALPGVFGGGSYVSNKKKTISGPGKAGAKPPPPPAPARRLSC